MQTQTFNILCVSREARDENSTSDYHIPSWAPTARLRTGFDEVLGVKIAKTVVQFGWSEYKLISVCVGLSGCAVALVVETDEPHYSHLTLYTDKPSCDRFTVEDVLQRAELEIRDKDRLADAKRLGWWPTSEQK